MTNTDLNNLSNLYLESMHNAEPQHGADEVANELREYLKQYGAKFPHSDYTQDDFVAEVAAYIKQLMHKV